MTGLAGVNFLGYVFMSVGVMFLLAVNISSQMIYINDCHRMLADFCVLSVSGTRSWYLERDRTLTARQVQNFERKWIYAADSDELLSGMSNRYRNRRTVTRSNVLK